MKKISSILVLMLIALMLFVSCNNSTPTKEESNSSSTDSSNNNSNDNTSTVTERTATDDDYTLFLNSYAVIIDDLENRINKDINIPNGVTSSSDGSTRTITFNSCEFDSYAINGKPLKVKLNGSATRATKEGEARVYYYTCNLTEGSSIGDIEYTLNTEFSVNNNTHTFNIESIKINDVKIEGFDELINSKINRDAKTEDAMIAKKLLAAFNHLELTPGLINSLIALEQLEFVETVDNESNKTRTFTFKNDCSFNFPLEEQEYSVVLNGTAEEYYIEDIPVSFMCVLSYGTKIDDTNHSIVAFVMIDTSTTPFSYNFNTAMIDYSMIFGLNELLASGSAE